MLCWNLPEVLFFFFFLKDIYIAFGIYQEIKILMAVYYLFHNKKIMDVYVNSV